MLLSIRSLLWSELPLAHCFEAKSSPIVISFEVLRKKIVTTEAYTYFLRCMAVFVQGRRFEQLVRCLVDVTKKWHGRRNATASTDVFSRLVARSRGDKAEIKSLSAKVEGRDFSNLRRGAFSAKAHS